MLVEFSVSNYKSFHGLQTVNFRATALTSDEKNRSIDRTNIVSIEDNRLLKTIGVYGANGSGKSNIIKALSFFRRMIAQSLNEEELIERHINPFRLIIGDRDNFGFFQCVLLLDGKRYRYGFTLGADFNIKDEWLFGPAEKNETYYYKRSGDKIEINHERFTEGRDLPLEKLRKNALFLTFCSSYDGEISQLIRRFFFSKTTVESSRHFSRFPMGIGNRQTNDLVRKGGQEVVLKWLKSAGLEYVGIKVKNSDAIPGSQVFLAKNTYDDKGEVQGTIDMDLIEDESDGTRKYYSYIGKLQEKFEEGGLYVVDEIDSNFHPALLQNLICMFNDPSINKSNAQLLFTSHDTNLMDPRFMRRDQFYFTEKTIKEETVIYALSDLKGIRNNADFARQYLAGFYGALPILHSYQHKDGTDSV